MRALVWVAILLLLAGSASGTHDEGKTFELLDQSVEPGTRRTLQLVSGRSFAGADLQTPVIVVHGIGTGPTLCLTAGVHGDEVNGIEIVRRIMASLEPESIRGVVVGIPIVNLSALRRGSRYLPDRRDLNRYFPGREEGSAAARIAHILFTSVIAHCSALVDFHTGSFRRTNLHQLRADLRNPAVINLASGFAAPTVLHKPGRPGTLRRATMDAGIPAITLEAGEPTRFSEAEVQRGVQGVERLLAYLGMSSVPPPPPRVPQTFYGRSHWVRADEGGILLGQVALGAEVTEDQVLGTVTNPLTEQTSAMRSPVSGRVVGIAFDQLVMPGFAAVHVAVPGGLDHLGSESDDGEDDEHLEREGLDRIERPE